ncbi:phage tail tape measure protein [Serratia marcescens]|uniref:phage tail tape measure protein n=1 Tax=Serratia marcescens TaxID=615 RepID=UPI003D1858ED
MAKRLDTEIIINLAGNLTAKARQYGANMSEFARRNERAMSVVKATSAAAGRGLDALGNRYTGIIAGFAGSAMLRDFATTDRRITRMGLAAEKTRKEMAEMYSGMQDSAIKFRVDDSEVVIAIEKVGTVTGDIDFGYKNRNIIAPSIAASGADGESIGALFSQFTKFNLGSEKETLQAMDTLNQLGKEGAFELKDIAERGVKAFSMYAAAGATGVKGIKGVGVALESAVDATGDTTTASTAVENLIRDLQIPKVVKTLRQNGISVYDKEGKMRHLPTLMGEIAQKSGSKGAEKQNARLLGAGFNQDSILLLSSVTSGKGAENLKRYNGVVADGQGIMKDAEYASKDFTSAMSSLKAQFTQRTPQITLPGLHRHRGLCAQQCRQVVTGTAGFLAGLKGSGGDGLRLGNQRSGDHHQGKVVDVGGHRGRNIDQSGGRHAAGKAGFRIDGHVIRQGLGRGPRGPVSGPLVAELVIDAQRPGSFGDQVFDVADKVTVMATPSP